MKNYKIKPSQNICFDLINYNNNLWEGYHQKLNRQNKSPYTRDIEQLQRREA